MIINIKFSRFLYLRMLILSILLSDLSRKVEVFIHLVARNVTNTSVVRHIFPTT